MTGSAKVTAEHLRRDAYLYVRQSSLKQVANNTESTWRQYDLRGRAIALGWTDAQITVIDTDQGRSGASSADRDGFQRLVAEVGLGRAGIVLGLEVSRLARNNTDWHRLLEICALTSTLILDEDGLYDPRTFNDRLVLGMKGTMSEAELHLLGARLRGGQLSKARRGELKQALPIGYCYDGADHPVLDPDAQIRGAVERLFALFAQTGSARAVVMAFGRDGLLFPARIRSGPRKGQVVWEPLKHWRVLSVLHNPCYAGAFCYGRRRTIRTPDGRIGSELLPRDQWDTLIADHHPGYISIGQWEANLVQLVGNAQSRGQERKAGPPREGPALLQGLVLCGRCGHRMTVGYRQYRDQLWPDYRCMTEAIQNGTRICQRIPGAKLDQAVADLLLAQLTPLAVETALAVTEQIAAREQQADQLRAAHLQRAEQRADLARRRYLAVDPGNRLVADTLEADWNAALREVRAARQEYDTATSAAVPLQQATRTRLTALAADVHTLWHDPATPMRERKRIARLLITDTLDKADKLTARIRLSGGQNHTLTLDKPVGGGKSWQTHPDTVTLIDKLLGEYTHRQIAAILNQRGIRSGKGRAYNALMVRDIRDAYQLVHRYQRLRDQGLLTVEEYAQAVGTTPQTVKIWRRNGLVTGVAYNDKNGYLFPAPGPDAPHPAQGRPFADRRPPGLGAALPEGAHLPSSSVLYGRGTLVAD
ncbi:recombinase family protein [Sphaerisporangium perillae]|uniref:recombinase family protein n=1 Tax=Sphaerisporangium perillae TaxID=2935860 RepID=UPI0024349AF8|nr:recombinase family protein [Sphaerisporangium perillae]